MIRYEDDCVCCDIPCINCGRKHAPHYYCDYCEEEFEPEDLFEFDDKMICEVCLLDQFKRVG